ncbi:glycoside hydrolase family 3 protein [Spirilliplanes yamanashiensis]|uniref:Beta-glucosidase n=1 Tax=Spirilliplanes yamanashiensis TaxID=42233 RepID=A0A8J3YBX9_9ACTN|nr:glycoside hydrolase family 3 C-terminal domain-containing protein [Spirilliplanes yamanashiensis]MDP9818141.1 beta-glucosidase [Spirilliplanes yamanashiensis]GIJ04952.1 beta-glucosidase [Spirilliplanes yamanashiensis]
MVRSGVVLRRPRRAALAAVVAVAVAVAVPVAVPATGAAPAVAAPADRPWTNAALSPDRRAALVLARMTLEEKVELMTGDQGAAPSAFYNAGIARLGIPELRMADAGAGIAPRGWTLPGTGGSATAMPSSIALGATFDPALARVYAGVVADEAKATRHAMLLGPNADPSRQPFWGRIAESGGEDPVLTSALVTSYVREVQRRRVIANLKHYTAYTQEVNRGLGQNSIVGERALREVHTLPYEAAVDDARLGSVMCAFNKINGVYACESDQALDTILRRQLGFTGFVITDFGAIHSTAPSVRAGTDMETGTRAFYDGPLLAAVRAGQVPESLVDRSVLRILRTMFAVGVFDTRYPATAIPARRHGAVAGQVQDEAITLLKNQRVLPLSARTRSVAVIGGDANIASTIGGSARVQPTYQVSVLDALRERGRRTGMRVVHEPGNDPVHGASMIETADMTAVPSSVLTPDSGTGTGVTARYWATPAPTGDPGLTRTEQQVFYDVGFVGGSPAFAGLYASQVPATPTLGAPTGGNQAARYTGFFTAPRTGVYRLGLTGWGEARAYLDDRLIIDMTGADGRRDVRSAPLTLTGGERHRLRVEYASTRPLVGLQPGTLLLQWSTPAGAYAPSVQRAAAAARRADVAVVYLRTYETEERDRVSLKLPQNADQLVRAVRAANPRTVVVLATGGPTTMPWLRDVPSVLQNWFGGQEEGNSLTRVLFGRENPSGRLPVTFPRTERALPPGVQNPWDTIGDLDVEFSEGVNIGYRGYRAAGVRPLFPFGHGLSYTSFRYSGRPADTVRATGRDDTAYLRVRVRNTGRRAGTEVVQVYLGRLPGVGSPALKLAGFAKVDLRPGQSRQVRIAVDRRELSYWDSAGDRWVTPRGTVRVHVGSSSADLRLTGTVTVR